MNNKQKLVLSLLFIICLLLGIYKFFISKVSNTDKKNNSEYYLVIDDVANLMYKNNKWYNVTKSKIESYSDYITYSYNNYLGQNNLKYGNVWNLFDKNGEYVNYKESLFAYSNNFNITKRDLTIRNLSDDDKNEITLNFNYSNFDFLLSNEVIDIDLDNNGVMDKIVCICNSSEDKNYKDYFYNLVYIKINDEIKIIINENSSNYNILQNDVYDLSYIFSTNKNSYFTLKKTYNVFSDSLNENIIMYDYTNISKIKNIKIN